MTDWKSREGMGPVKGRQLESAEDRAAAYGQWRWNLGEGLYVQDVDQVEYRAINGVLTPVAVLELTRVDDPRGASEGYLKAILDRMQVRDPQSLFICDVALMLRVNAYVIVWRRDLTRFWGYNLSRSLGWKTWDQDGYKKWLASLIPMDLINENTQNQTPTEGHDKGGADSGVPCDPSPGTPGPETECGSGGVPGE